MQIVKKHLMCMFENPAEIKKVPSQSVYKVECVVLGRDTAEHFFGREKEDVFVYFRLLPNIIRI